MLTIGCLKGQNSVLTALVPSIAQKLKKEGYQIFLENGVGEESFYQDKDYVDVEFKKREEILASSDVLLLSEPELSQEEVSQLKNHTVIIGRFTAQTATVELLRSKEVTVFDLDKVPRSSIAQSMDVLSSLASLSGYKAVINAANHFSGYLPMMTTAAGTVPPAKVLILGAGVAGLQAIATAKRLGAVVEAFDVRSAVKEEVESLGAKFVEVEGGSEDKEAGGYAVEQTKTYQELQKKLIHERSVKSDIIITTANIPGRKAPILIEKETIDQMKMGSVVVDMATVSGGNCVGSKDNETINLNGVTVIGSSKLYEELPKEASRLYSTNLYNLLKFIAKDGLDNMPLEHDIVQKTIIHTFHQLETSTN